MGGIQDESPRYPTDTSSSAGKPQHRTGGPERERLDTPVRGASIEISDEATAWQHGFGHMLAQSGLDPAQLRRFFLSFGEGSLPPFPAI